MCYTEIICCRAGSKIYTDLVEKPARSIENSKCYIPLTTKCPGFANTGKCQEKEFDKLFYNIERYGLRRHKLQKTNRDSGGTRNILRDLGRALPVLKVIEGSFTRGWESLRAV